MEGEIERERDNEINKESLGLKILKKEKERFFCLNENIF